MAKKKYAPNSISDFIAWLKTQNGRRKYDWYDCTSCVFHDYLKDGCGAKTDSSGFVQMDYAAPVGGDGDAYHEIGRNTPWTFAAVRERAIKWQKRQSVLSQQPQT